MAINASASSKCKMVCLLILQSYVFSFINLNKNIGWLNAVSK